MEVRLAELGLRFDRYLEYTGGSVEKLRAERRPAAADSVRLELALGALATAEQIEVDELQVEHEVDRIGAGRRLSGQDRRRLHAAAHVDLLRRAAAERACEIAAGGA
jgi:capsular polysaccharide biosynthesis protein